MMSGNKFLKQTKLGVYYLVFEGNPIIKKSELSWIQKLYLRKAKAYFPDETLVDDDDDEMKIDIGNLTEEANLVKILSSNEEPLTVTEASCLTTMKKYANITGKRTNNKCISEATFTCSPSDSITWASSQSVPKITYPQSIEQNKTKWLGYFKKNDPVWNRIDPYYHFFWRNRQIPTHEIQHSFNADDAVWTTTSIPECNVETVTEGQDLYCDHSLTKSEGFKRVMGWGATAPPIKVSENVFNAKGEQVEGSCNSKSNFNAEEPCGVTYKELAKTQLKDGSFKRCVPVDGCKLSNSNCKPEFTKSTCQKTDTYKKKDDITQDRNFRICNIRKPRILPNNRGGPDFFKMIDIKGKEAINRRNKCKVAMGKVYRDEWAASAANLLIFIEYYKEKIENANNPKKKAKYQLIIINGVLYVYVLLKIMRKIINSGEGGQSGVAGSSKKAQRLLKIINKWPKFENTYDLDIIPKGAGWHEFKKINVLTGSGIPDAPWSNTYSKHLVALYYALNFFEGGVSLNMLKDLMSGEIWSADNIDTYVEAAKDFDIWDAKKDPEGLSEWITKDYTASKGGRRRRRRAKKRRKTRRKIRRKTRRKKRKTRRKSRKGGRYTRKK